MDAFRHILTLLSFVLALSLTNLLLRVGVMVIARERVVFSSLGSIAIINSVLLVYLNWLSFWDIRNTPQWTLFAISLIFVFALTVFFVSTLAAPHGNVNDEKIDMDQFYWHQRKAFYWTWFACQLLAITGNILFFEGSQRETFLEENDVNLAMLPPILLALLVERRWAQWTGSLGLLGANIFYLFSFVSEIS